MKTVDVGVIFLGFTHPKHKHLLYICYVWVKHFLEHFVSSFTTVLLVFVQIGKIWWSFMGYPLRLLSLCFTRSHVSRSYERNQIFELFILFLHSLFFYDFFDVQKRLWKLLTNRFAIDILLKTKSICCIWYLEERVLGWRLTPCSWWLLLDVRGTCVETGCITAI